MAGVTRIGESPPPGWCLSTMTSLENGRPTIVDDGLRKSDSRRRRNGGAVARTGRPPRRRASRLARNGVITTQRPMRAQTRRGRSLRASTFRDPWCRMQIKNNYEIRVRARTKCEAHGNRGGGRGGQRNRSVPSRLDWWSTPARSRAKIAPTDVDCRFEWRTTKTISMRNGKGRGRGRGVKGVRNNSRYIGGRNWVFLRCNREAAALLGREDLRTRPTGSTAEKTDANKRRRGKSRAGPARSKWTSFSSQPNCPPNPTSSLDRVHLSEEFDWRSRTFIGFYWVLLGFIGFYWVSLDFTAFRRALRWLIVVVLLFVPSHVAW